MFLRETNDIEGETALVDAYENRITYGELEQMSENYLTLIPSRSLIMILCDYGIDTVSFYYCQMNNHVVPILVDNKLNQDLLNNLIRTYQPEYIWCDEEKSRELLQNSGNIVLCKGNHVLIKTGYGTCNMDIELALLLTTSGSTGSIKMVRLSYNNLISNIKDYINIVNLQMSDRGITTLPMHYCYGLSILHAHWMVGASVYITDYSLLNINFWDFFDKSQITNFAGVPYVYDILLNIGFFDKTYPSLKFLTVGGGKLSENKQEIIGNILIQKEIRFYLCYGQTEVTTYISILDSNLVVKKIGSIGKTMPGIEAMLIGANERMEGELVCKGNSVSLGYAQSRDDLMRGDSNQGFVNTGDIAYIDNNGDIYLRGRSKRFIKMLGKRISLDEVEGLLNCEYKENEFACVGIEDKLMIYHTGDLDSVEVQQFCKRKILLQSKLCIVKKIDNIPRNDAGKVLYAKLQK